MTTQPLKEQPPKMFSAADTLLYPIPEILPVLGKVITQGSSTLLVGESGTGKTYVALSLGTCIVAGISWLDMPTRQGPVLFIDEESGNTRLRHRVRNVLHGYGLQAEQVRDFHLVWGEGINLRDKDGIAKLERYIQMTSPVLVVIDALADVIPGANENAVAEVHPPLKEIRRIAETYQTAVITLHHTNKAGGFRGSSTMKADVDNMIMLESGAKNSLKFHSEKMRDTEPIKFSAVTHFGDDSFYMEKGIEKQSGKYSGNQIMVIQAFQEHGSLTANRVHRLTSIPLNSVRKLLPDLEKSGLLVRVGGKQGTAVEYRLSDLEIG